MSTQSQKSTARLCAGCRERGDRASLLRFVLSPHDDSLVPDLRARLPGRGVWVHPVAACVRLAVKRGGFNRGLRRSMKLDAQTLCAMAQMQFDRRIHGLVQSATGARKISIGATAVQVAIQEGRALLLMVATDAGGARTRLIEAMRSRDMPWVSYGTKESLGKWFGRAEVGVLAIHEQGIAVEVLTAVKAATSLSEAE